MFSLLDKKNYSNVSLLRYCFQENGWMLVSWAATDFLVMLPTCLGWKQGRSAKKLVDTLWSFLLPGRIAFSGWKWIFNPLPDGPLCLPLSNGPRSDWT